MLAFRFSKIWAKRASWEKQKHEQIFSRYIISRVTGARHYLHFGEILGHGVRTPMGVTHWRGRRSAKWSAAGIADLFFSQGHLFEGKICGDWL
jgi:hypothetical protein